MPKREDGRAVQDDQKNLLYTAEGALPRGALYPTINDAQRRVNQIVGSDWFRELAPGLDYIEVVPTPVVRQKVALVGGRTGYCVSRLAVSKNRVTRIGLSRMGRREFHLLHEIAHQVTDHLHGIDAVPGHGALFAHYLLRLVSQYMGIVAAETLRASFEKNRVAYVPSEEDLALRRDETSERRYTPRRPVIDDLIKGEVRRRLNQITGYLMVMIDARRSDGRYATTADKPWVVVCARTGNFATFRTRQEAKTWMGYPTWCEHCAPAVRDNPRNFRSKFALIDRVGWDDERI